MASNKLNRHTDIANWVAGLVALLAVTGCGALTSVDTLLERAEKQLAVGDYGNAVIELRNALDKEPASGRGQLLLVRVYLQMGNLEAASEAIDAASNAGVNAQTLTPLKGRLQLQQQQYARLLKSIDDGTLSLPKPLDAFYRAQALKGLRQFDEAITSFDALIAAANEPTLTSARIGLAESLVGHGNLGLALKTLEAATKANPSSAETWLAHGNLLRLFGQSTEAEKSWSQALKTASGQLTVLQHVALINAMADSALTKGDLAATKLLVDQVVAISPRSVSTALLSQRLQLAQGDASTATADLQRLLNSNPDVVAVRPLLTAALLAQGASEQADQQISEMLAAAPGNARLKALQTSVKGLSGTEPGSTEFWLRVGACQIALGVPDAARVSFAKAASAEPASVVAGAAQASLELRAGRPREALSRAQQLQLTNPNDAMVAALLGETQLALGQYAEASTAYAASWSHQRSASTAAALWHARRLANADGALEPLELWLMDNPGDTATRGIYADALRLAGQPARAIAEYQRLLDLAPRTAAALNNLAWLYYLQKDARALATARQAYQIRPDAPEIADTYGWLLVDSGNPAEGLKILRVALNAAAGQPDIVYHYAVALARTGDSVGARRFVDGALAIPGAFDARAAAATFRAAL